MNPNDFKHPAWHRPFTKFKGTETHATPDGPVTFRRYHCALCEKDYTAPVGVFGKREAVDASREVVR